MPYSIGFIMEQTLGQVTHDLNLRQRVARDPDVRATWMPVAFDVPDVWSKVPIVRNNWTLQASARARRQVQIALRSHRFDALFFHTPVTALFAHGLMTQIPTIVSMDATPLNLDTVGTTYGHEPRSGAVEALKNTVTARTLRRARLLVTWCDWAKQSLMHDYGIDASKTLVIPPGVDLAAWQVRPKISDATRPVRLLFVGGDFRRKGGEVLLSAFSRNLTGRCELDIVTRGAVDVAGLPGVRIHNGLTPNDPALRALFMAADVFVFPTLGDCLPIVILEAMACGLPVVATPVGAIREEVEDGVTGVLTRTGDSNALGEAVLRLVENATVRRDMGAAGRRRAEMFFDGEQNYGRVLSACKQVIDQANHAELNAVR